VTREIQRARDEVAWQLSQTRARVAVGVSPAAAMLLLPPALARLRSRWPQVTVRAVDALYPSSLTMLRTGEIDLAVGPLPAGGSGRDLQAHALFEADTVVAARRDHPLAQARSLTDLAEAAWVLTGPDGGPGDPAKLDFRGGQQGGIAHAPRDPRRHPPDLPLAHAAAQPDAHPEARPATHPSADLSAATASELAADLSAGTAPERAAGLAGNQSADATARAAGRPPVVLLCESFATLLSLLPSIEALALVPRSFFDHHGPANGLVRVPVAEPLPKVTLYAVWRAEAPLSVPASRLLDALTVEAARHRPVG
jgi:DNA-binding transcriptional LysR family regulator